MKKKLLILSLLINCSLLNAQGGGDCDPEGGALFGVVPAGNSTQWLYQELPSTSVHPHEVDPDLGGGCGHNIQITTPNDTSTNVAYYTKNHNDPSEVRFRFILSTEDLLQSFDTTGDTLQFYNFRFKDASNIERDLLKVRLKKNNTFTNRWEIKTQWYDTVNGGSVRRSVYFDENDDFVEFEFFWEKADINNNAGQLLYNKTSAGLVLKVGNGVNNKPQYILSPYTYDAGPHAYTSSLVGKSSLGYISPSTNPSPQGDVIRILSPLKYGD